MLLEEAAAAAAAAATACSRSLRDNAQVKPTHGEKKLATPPPPVCLNRNGKAVVRNCDRVRFFTTAAWELFAGTGGGRYPLLGGPLRGSAAPAADLQGAAMGG